MKKRSSIRQTVPLKDRLASFAQDSRDNAAQLQPGPERDDLLKKARQAENAARLDDWANSPGLQAPK